MGDIIYNFDNNTFRIDNPLIFMKDKQVNSIFLEKGIAKLPEISKILIK